MSSWFDEILIQAASGKGPWKLPVRAAATGNITLSGLQTIDGVTLAQDDDVFLALQTTQAENGLWRASSGSWTRRSDADTAEKLFCGSSVYVREGTTNGKTAWRLTTTGTIVLGTTALVFEELPSVRDKFARVRRAQATTTDATPTNISAAAITMADNTTLQLELRVKGDQTSGSNSASFRRIYTYKRVAGAAPALVGAVSDVHVRTDDSSWDAVLTVSVNDLVPRVTGNTGQTVSWDAAVEAF